MGSVIGTKTEADPRPACSAAGRGEQEWRTRRYTERLSAFYEPCTRSGCFPQGDIDTETGEWVVLSRHHGGSCHRPTGQSTGETSAVASDGGTIDDPFADCEHVPVRSITDLHPGDGVVWDGVTQPLVVRAIRAARDVTDLPSALSTDVVHMKGPGGGDYFLEFRPGSMANVVYPGRGKVAGLRRMRGQATRESSPPSAYK